MSPSSWMIYGANGYTGRMLADEAAHRGLKPILAGRSRAPIAALADDLGCPMRVFDLGSVETIVRRLEDVAVVANCAGPFSATAGPMMDACIRAGVHYVDITGEIDVIEAGAGRHEDALSASVTLLPAAGFDVVPSDCLAAMLAAELPTATHLQLAFGTNGGLSPGTAKTSIEGISQGGRVRIDGTITPVPTAWKTMEVPFRHQRRMSVTIPWGDVASAYYSTGIPNIEVYMAMPPEQIKRLRRMRFLLPLLGWGPVQRFLKRRIARSVPGPTPEELDASRCWLWGHVWDDEGQSVEATLETPGGYPLTVSTMLSAVEKMLAGEAPAGFVTPSRAFGKDFILSIPGTDLRMGTKNMAGAA